MTKPWSAKGWREVFEPPGCTQHQNRAQPLHISTYMRLSKLAKNERRILGQEHAWLSMQGGNIFAYWKGRKQLVYSINPLELNIWYRLEARIAPNGSWIAATKAPSPWRTHD